MEENNPHILGSAPIGKLLVQYSVPAIIAMTVTSLYNIIDSIFIGHGVGPLAISGLAITFPLMNLLVAFCTLVGVGGASISSIRLGQKDVKGAEDVLGNVAILCVINAFIYGGITLLFLDEVLYFFGASDETLPYARDFMQVILLGSPITYVTIGLNNMMRATGYPKKAMFSAMLTVGCNIILAPVCIFVLEWGIRGAAISTIISQFAGMIWVLSHFVNKKSYIRFKRVSLRLRPRIIRNIFSIGMSPFIMNVCACCIVIFINNRLLNYGGDLAIGAFGILNRIQMLFVMIVMGITMGMQPISGYNYGAGNSERVRKTFKLLLAVCLTYSLLLWGLIEMFPQGFAKMFSSDAALIDFTAHALRIYCAVLCLFGIQMSCQMAFVSIGSALCSISVAVVRKFVLLLPLIYIMPMLASDKTMGVYMAEPVADVIAITFTSILFAVQFGKAMKKLEGQKKEGV